MILLGLFFFVVHGEGGDERMSKTNAHKLKCTRTLSLSFCLGFVWEFLLVSDAPTLVEGGG